MSWLTRLFSRRRLYHDLSAEIAAHLQEKIDALIASGMSRAEATRTARREFGNATLLEERSREVWQWPSLESFFADVRFAFRMLRKSPGFTAVAILTLALGIGANTAIFSVVNAVILQPLPFPHPDQLVAVSEISSKSPKIQQKASYPDFLDWQRDVRSFSALAAYTQDGLTLTGHGEPAVIPAAIASSSLFDVLGMRPLLGRTLEFQDDRKGAARVAVIGEGLWRGRLGSDPHVVGKTIKLNSELFTVVGVMPASFHFPDQDPPTELWIPVRQSEDFQDAVDQRYASFLSVIGRTRPGVTMAQAQSELNVIIHSLAKQFNLDPNLTSNVISLKQLIVGDLRLALLVLLGAVGLVVLIACANIANLLLARATARSKEMAVRVALGAGRARLFRQLLTESVLLSVCAGLVGLLLAHWGVDGIKALNSHELPHLRPIGVDGWVLAFTFAISVFAGILFGLAPAWQSSEIDVNESLKEGGRSSAGGSKSHRTRHALVAAEVAVAIVLLVGAGLLLKSFYLLTQTSPGFDPQHLLKADILLPQSQYTKPDQWSTFYRQAVDRLKSLPGVEGAAAALPLPFTGSYVGWGFTRTDQPAPKPGQVPTASAHSVTAGYFRVMRIPLLRGREFNDSDLSPNAADVVIINETLTRRYFPNENPIGQNLKIYGPSRLPIDQIVGVVGDVKDKTLTEAAAPMLYFPYTQQPWWVMSLVVRTKGDPMALASPMRDQIHQMDPALPLDDLGSMASFISDSETDARFRSMLLGMFAVLALVLATVGIYSVLAYAVVQRTHEIGIRMALGAQRRDVLHLIVRQGMAAVLVGVAIGVAAAVAFSRVLASFLYGVSDKDPLTFVAVSLLLTLVALLACYIPARRAMKVDPMVALRYE